MSLSGPPNQLKSLYARPLAKGTQRLSALRTALDGLRGRASVAGAFPALALGVADSR